MMEVETPNGTDIVTPRSLILRSSPRMTSGFSPDTPIATCLLIQSSGLLGNSVAGGYLWKPSLHKSVKESQMHESSALLGIAISLLTRSRVGFRSGEVRKFERASGLEHPLSYHSSSDLYRFCVVGVWQQRVPSLPTRGSTAATLTSRCKRCATAGTPEGVTLQSGPVSPVAG